MAKQNIYSFLHNFTEFVFMELAKISRAKVIFAFVNLDGKDLLVTNAVPIAIAQIKSQMHVFYQMNVNVNQTHWIQGDCALPH